MSNINSRNRLIKGENYVLVMEEVTSTTLLYDMFLQMSSLIAGSEVIMREIDKEIPNLTGQQFVVIHYYDNFVSPRNFQGYGIVMMTMVPENVNDIIREMIKQADDEALGKVFLMAVRNDESEKKIAVLKNESNRVIQARVKTLRNL